MKKCLTFNERFIGAALGPEWSVADTSSAGSPTKAMHADGYKMQFDSQAEAQNLCLYWGDILSIPVANIRSILIRLKMLAATKDTTTTLALGVASARNDTTDSIAVNAMLKIVSTSTDLALVAETDDGTTDTDDKATGKSLDDDYIDCRIDFNCGLADVRFFVDGQPVATGTTFSMAAATGGVQPFVQIQKTSDTNTDGVVVREIEVDYVQ